MHKIPEDLDPKIRTRVEKIEKMTKRSTHIILHALHQIEHVIAYLTVGVLMVALVYEIVAMFSGDYFTDLSGYLHSILTIVVGLEFVRMLIDTTPANILEVLTLAITRHVILSHDDPVSNIVSVMCIAGLFAIRRFLIPKEELREEMVEVE